MDEPGAKSRPSIRQLSKTPSWVMLGFIIGAAFVWALPRRDLPPRPIIVTPAEPPRTPSPRELTTVEELFTAWQEYAVWDRDVTQIAVWNSGLREFADYYEVRRMDGGLYFRSIPKLTNLELRHGRLPPSDCPIRFTETEAQYRDWREHGRFERPAEVGRLVLPVQRPTIDVRPDVAHPPPPAAPQPEVNPEVAKPAGR